jgi:hypothetical protein
MVCETCNSLVAEYKRRVKLFTDEVLKTPGALGHDATLAAKQLDLLQLKCQDAREAVVTHWRQDQDNLAPAITLNGSKSVQ